MNARAAKLIRKAAVKTGEPVRSLKRAYLRTPAPRRAAIKKMLRNCL